MTICYIKFIIGIFILSAFSCSLKAQKTGKLSLTISHVVGSQPLKLDSVHYKNSLDQDFSVSKFKYYIGQIQLKQANGKTFHSNSYFLINEDEQESKHIQLENVPYGNYTSISFLLGVDSLSNCSGAQSGALDPINGMFWAWNSGYIFLKLEGTSTASPHPAKIIEYHIGGYKQPSQCIRTIQLPFEEMTMNEKNSIISLSLRADVSKILSSESKIDFKTHSSVTDFHNATLIAGNYKNMFSVSVSKHEN